MNQLAPSKLFYQHYNNGFVVNLCEKKKKKKILRYASSRWLYPKIWTLISRVPESPDPHHQDDPSQASNVHFLTQPKNCWNFPGEILVHNHRCRRHPRQQRVCPTPCVIATWINSPFPPEVFHQFAAYCIIFVISQYVVAIAIDGWKGPFVPQWH